MNPNCHSQNPESGLAHDQYATAPKPNHLFLQICFNFFVIAQSDLANFLTDGTPFSIIYSSRRPAKHDGREYNNFLPVNHHFRFYYDQDITPI